MVYILRGQIPKTKGKRNFANIATFPSMGLYHFSFPVAMCENNCFLPASSTGHVVWVFVNLVGKK